MSEPFFPMGELVLAVAVAGFVMLTDALCRPRPPANRPLRSAPGAAVLLAAGAIALGAALVITGALLTSVVLVAGLAALVALVSNVKNKVLGEPLVFSDFALLGALFQHPHFYISALRGWQMMVILGGAAGLLAVLLRFSSLDLAPRLWGLAIAALAGTILVWLLRLAVWRAVRASPDVNRDVRDHGLIATLLVHWTGWRILPDPTPCAAPPIIAGTNPVVVVVQCESFTDPADLLHDAAFALPGLAEARSVALQHGRLLVPGFGAYTMRTEYGVLFGRNEEQLGLRKFDPFLTAHREASFCLTKRLCDKTWTSFFVHPHDLRFYGRDRLMVEAGFGTLVGEPHFSPPPPGHGRYVSDAAVADAIINLARASASATLIYAVTIENHGPWPVSKGGSTGPSDSPYLRLVRNSDAMLARLVRFARDLDRPVILCFFGDHRPSIPAMSEPGEERHTPYVLVSYEADGSQLYDAPVEVDLTPAQLHHRILEVIGAHALRVGQA